MAVEVLRTAVERQVEAPFWGPKIDRAGESVVDHRDQAISVGKFYRGMKIGYVHEWIGDGFEINSLCLRL